MTTETVQRREWVKPELTRLEAGKAEIGNGNNTDALNTAS